MSTLKIKNVDFNELEKQRKLLIELRSCIIDLDVFAEESNWSEPIDSILNMLNKWSDERKKKALGSIENQKAKKRQLSLPWFICPNCDTESANETCPTCNRISTPTEFVK